MGGSFPVDGRTPDTVPTGLRISRDRRRVSKGCDSQIKSDVKYVGHQSGRLIRSRRTGKSDSLYGGRGIDILQGGDGNDQLELGLFTKISAVQICEEFAETDVSRGFINGLTLHIVRNNGAGYQALGSHSGNVAPWGAEHHACSASTLPTASEFWSSGTICRYPTTGSRSRTRSSIRTDCQPRRSPTSCTRMISG